MNQVHTISRDPGCAPAPGTEVTQVSYLESVIALDFGSLRIT